MVPRRVSEPFYHSKAWIHTRSAYINSVSGLCERCLAKGIIKPGYIVHHKHYLTEDNITDPSVTLNWDNLEYLCFACHQAEHFGKSESTESGLTFDANGQLVPDSHSPRGSAGRRLQKERARSFE